MGSLEPVVLDGCVLETIEVIGEEEKWTRSVDIIVPAEPKQILVVSGRRRELVVGIHGGLVEEQGQFRSPAFGRAPMCSLCDHLVFLKFERIDHCLCMLG